MIVKNIYIEKANATLIELILKRLSLSNISYVLIKDKNYIELHFDKYVYKIYFYNKNIDARAINDTVENMLNYSFNDSDLSYTWFDSTLAKKYTRKDIVRDNKNSNCKIKIRRSRLKVVRHKIT